MDPNYDHTMKSNRKIRRRNKQRLRRKLKRLQHAMEVVSQQLQRKEGTASKAEPDEKITKQQNANRMTEYEPDCLYIDHDESWEELERLAIN